MNNKNILILGLGSFGFAIAKHLGENNPGQTFFASEVNAEICHHIQETRQHPFFFEGVKLPGNIELRENPREILPQIDIIISVIPCQFVGKAFADMKDFLKDGVTILNLSKGIDNQSLQTVGEKLKEIFSSSKQHLSQALSYQEREQATETCSPFLLAGERIQDRGINEEKQGQSFSYAYLAGGMIARELVEGNKLGADIVTENGEIGEYLKNLFQSENLDINLKICKPKNTELYAALKNIIALILGYYEGKGFGASTLGYYFSKLLGEMMGVIQLLNSHTKPHPNPLLKERERATSEEKTAASFLLEEKIEGGFVGEQIDFTDYALSGDLIATCFGDSRNRLLGKMLGEGKDIGEALEELRSQNKIAEGYETLKGVYTLTQGKEGFEEINNFGEKFL